MLTLASVRRPIRSLDATVFVCAYLVLLFLVPSRLVVSQVGAVGTPANLLGLIGLVWWCCTRLRGVDGYLRHTSPVRVVLGLMVLSVLASYAAGCAYGWYAPSDVRQATDQVYDLMTPTASDIREKMLSALDRGLISVGAWCGVVLVATDGLRTWSDIDRVVRCLVYLSTVVAAMGVLQFFTGYDVVRLIQIPGLGGNFEYGGSVTRSILRRVSATAIHPIEFGVVMSAVFPFALHRAIHAHRRLSAWVPVVVIGLAIPMSISRSAMVVLGVVGVLLFAGWPASWRRRGLILAPLAVVGVRVLVPGLVGTVISLFTNLFVDASTTGRTDDYSVVLRSIKEHITLGQGFFTFIPRYYRTLDNQYLVSLLETGVVGTLIFLAVFVVAYSSARAARRRAIAAPNQHLALVISASTAALAVTYATFDALSFPMAAGITFVIVGLAGAVWRIALSEAQADLDRVPSLASPEVGARSDVGP